VGSRMAKRRRRPCWDLVPKGVGKILCIVGHPHMAQISKRRQNARESVITELLWFAGRKGGGGYGSPGAKVFLEGGPLEPK
jgi:hypothetical protein